MNDYKKYLTEYFITENNISDDTQFTIEEVDARSLLVPERIDLIAKWIYIDFKERALKSDYGKRLYEKHIEAFSLGTFEEPGTPDKNTFDNYVNEFDSIIREIKKNGFDRQKSLVPIGDDDIALDGAHRIAACAYFNKPITIIRFHGLRRKFDCNFFAQRGLDPKYLDALTVQYCKLKPNIYAACIWPKVYTIDKFKKADEIISQSSLALVQKKQVKINYKGLKNLLLQIYGHHSWTGDYTNGFKGTERKVDEIYANNNTVAVYVIEAESVDQIIDLKNKIRDVYRIENSSVHITDNQTETVQLVNILFNSNSLHHINYAKLEKNKPTHKLVSEFKNLLDIHNENLEDYAIDSSSVLSMYGVRGANDLDYLSTSSTGVDFKHPSIDSHASQEGYYAIHKDGLIHNPENYFIFNDIKFINLDNVLKMKKARNEKKDQDDIYLVRSAIGSGKKRGFDYGIPARIIKIKSQHEYALNKARTIKFLDHIGLKKPLLKIRKRIKNTRT